MSTIPSLHPRASCPERRAPPPPRLCPPALWHELQDAHEFQRVLERACLSSRRQGEALSVLVLQARFSSTLPLKLQTELLAECTRRLRSRVRSTDSLLGWQACHFAVLLQRCEAEHAAAVLQRLTQCATGTYRLGEQLLQLNLQGELARCEAG